MHTNGERQVALTPALPQGEGEPFTRRRFIASLITAGALSFFFIVVYGLTNTLASKNPNVGTWYYAWERFIPFVPILIVPYMSIDAFFFVAPFLCTTARERVTLAKRITLAIAVAGLFFWQMPLTLAVSRPQVDGWLGVIFRSLHGFDEPHNLLPSLHIALRSILVSTYVRHTRGLMRGAVHVWFSLIGLSTLLVYQHHVVDIVGGFLLGAVCCYLFVDEKERTSITPNPRVGRLYLIGAVLFAGLAFTWPWWSLWLLWPATSLAIAASSYFGAGASIYRKADGQIPIAARLVLGPFLIGQWLSWLGYARRSEAYNRVSEQVLIGRRLTPSEARTAIIDANIVAVIDLTGEFSECLPLRALPYLNVQVADLTPPTPSQVRQCLDFIDHHSQRGSVYVHCKAGYSRSAAIAGAHLLTSDHSLSAEEAITRLYTARHGIVIRPEIRSTLQAFALSRDANVPLSV